MNDDGGKVETCSIFRGLIVEIRLVPIDSKVRIHLEGNLPAMLAYTTKDDRARSS
ncbi:MAG: hypothetical protein O3B21_10360 [Proteobacteria bacterium]|nr:hypothetical protein [Pseudomonadota bacterium]MDA1357404.1 hypothetical protein [Pseudomonadota bacterium]